MRNVLKRWGKRVDCLWVIALVVVLWLVGCAEGAQRKAGESEADWGERLFRLQGCIACHSLSGVLLQGPPVGQVWLGTVKLASGEVTIRDEQYLRRSILEPSSELREGFFPVMTPYLGLTDEQVDALVAFVRARSVPGPGGSDPGQTDSVASQP